MQKKLYTKWMWYYWMGVYKMMQTNAMWLHLMGFVKTCHATRSQQNGCDCFNRALKTHHETKKKIEQNAWCGFLKQYFGWFNMLVQWTSPFSFVS